MSQITIDHVHYHVHAGYHFTVCHAATGVANNGNLDIRFKTGAKSCHSIFDVAPSAKAQFYVYEAATISAGTALAAYNNNRNSAKETTATVTHTPTVTATGTINPIKKFLGSGTPGIPIGALENTRNELILKPNTEYLIRLTNTSGSAADLGICVFYYEI
jgi:hypothetical protein